MISFKPDDDLDASGVSVHGFPRVGGVLPPISGERGVLGVTPLGVED
jgi:hypothetical protein